MKPHDGKLFIEVPKRPKRGSANSIDICSQQHRTLRQGLLIKIPLLLKHHTTTILCHTLAINLFLNTHSHQAKSRRLRLVTMRAVFNAYLKGLEKVLT
jgi:hypothetical protein